MRKTFILGAHRTATKTLSVFFTTHYPRAACVHQYPMLRLVNIVSNMFLAGFLPELLLKAVVYAANISHIKRHSQSTAYIVPNGFNFLAAKYVKRLCDDVGIIHILRDPRDWVVSYLNFIAHRWQSRIAHTAIPFWRLPGYAAGRCTKPAWKKLSVFEKFCWHWTLINDFIAATYSNDSGNYLAIKLESLSDTASRIDTLNKMLAFAGLAYVAGSESVFDKRYNTSRAGAMAPWQQWSGEQAVMLDSICGPLMKRYGYGGEKEWTAKTGGNDTPRPA